MRFLQPNYALKWEKRPKRAKCKMDFNVNYSCSKLALETLDNSFSNSYFTRMKRRAIPVIKKRSPVLLDRAINQTNHEKLPSHEGNEASSIIIQLN